MDYLILSIVIIGLLFATAGGLGLLVARARARMMSKKGANMGSTVAVDKGQQGNSIPVLKP